MSLAINGWEGLRKGRAVTTGTAQAIYSYMSGNGVRVKRGHKTISADDNEMFELKDLQEELENFQREKERVRTIIGQIGGVPKFHNMLFNWALITATGICLIISLLVDHLSVRLLMIELASAAVSVKIIYLIQAGPHL